MYIPISYFGVNQNLCISASGGDDIGHVIYESQIWKYHAFTSTGSHQYIIHSGSSPHKLVVVGAGGGGGMAVNLDRSTGGGGAGGFVFLDNLPMVSGSYDLHVGAGFQSTITVNGWSPAVCSPSTYDYPQSYSGQTSSFQYVFTPTSTDDGYYIPSASITAYGGGAGANIWRTCTADGTSIGSVGLDGAAGGGGSQWGDGTAFTKYVNPGLALYNLNGLPPHGFDAGDIITGSSLQGSGGGGSSSTGSSNITVGTNSGGIGVSLLEYVGIDQSVCFGGPGGEGASSWRAPSYTSGSGGAAAKASDTTLQKESTKGGDGLVLLMYRLCKEELKNCTTYVVNGGGSGGNVYYIPCNGGTIESASLLIGEEATICTLPLNLKNSGTNVSYPYSDGTVSLTPSGSCSLDIPIIPYPTCDTGSTATPMYIYDFETPQACYPTPESCQRIYSAAATINYWDQDGPAVYEFSGGFISNTGQICAREFPQPEITCSVLAGGSGTCTITKTDLVCGYYCSGSV